MDDSGKDIKSIGEQQDFTMATPASHENNTITVIMSDLSTAEGFRHEDTNERNFTNYLLKQDEFDLSPHYDVSDNGIPSKPTHLDSVEKLYLDDNSQHSYGSGDIVLSKHKGGFNTKTDEMLIQADSLNIQCQPGALPVHKESNFEAKRDPVIQYSWTFQCGQCDATLSSTYSLKRHISEVHKGIKYYAKQKPNQEYSVSSKNTLKKRPFSFIDNEREQCIGGQSKVVPTNKFGEGTHKNMKQREFKCKKCNAKLSCDYNLRRHISEVHHGVKYCKKRKTKTKGNDIASFNNKSDDQMDGNEMFYELVTKEGLLNDQDTILPKTVLVNKPNKNTNGSTFECEICNSTLSCEYNLKRHKSEVHNKVKYYAKHKLYQHSTISFNNALDDQPEQNVQLHELDQSKDLSCDSLEPLQESVIPNKTNRKEKKTKFECVICNACLSCEYNLDRHVSEVHNKVKYYKKQNQNESNTVSTQQELDDESDQDEMFLKSDTEDIDYDPDYVLPNHRPKNKTNKKIKDTSFECEICNVSLSCEYNLKRHVSEVHHGVKYFAKQKPYRHSTVSARELRDNQSDKHEINKVEGQSNNSDEPLLKDVSANIIVRKANQPTFKCEAFNKSFSCDYNVQWHVSEEHKGVKYFTKRKRSEYETAVSSGRFDDQEDKNGLSKKLKLEDGTCYGVQDYVSSENILKQTTSKKTKQKQLECVSPKKEPDSQSEQDEILNKLDNEEKKSYYDQEKLLTKSVLERKSKKKKEQKIFECEICTASLRSEYNLKRHVAEVHNQRKFIKPYKHNKKTSYNQLPQDEFVTLPSRQLESSVDNNQEYDNLITCKYCNITVKGKYSFWRHLIEVHQCIRIDIRHSKMSITKSDIGKNDDNNTKLFQVYPQVKQRKCCLCGVPFSTSQSLGYHMNEMHQIDPSVKLEITSHQGETGKNTESPLQHVSCKLKINLSCNKCERIFTKLTDAKSHFRNAHVEKPELKEWYQSCVRRAKKHKANGVFQCDTCNVVHKTLDKLNNHVKDHIGTISDETAVKQRVHPLKYPSAGQHSPPNEEFTCNRQADKVTQCRRKLYKCSVCQKEFSSQDKLQNHISLHAGKMSYSCFACQKTFLCQKYLIRHMKKHVAEHKPNIRYTCNICKKELSSFRQYQRHINSNKHVPEGHWLCDICSKTYKSLNSLQAHRKSHSDPRFTCNLCGARFVRKDTLERHYLVHTALASYVCTICSRTFKEKDRLIKHSLIHNPERERSFSCTMCLKSFYTKPQLMKHKRHVHMVERNFACPYCDKGFFSQSYLNNHLKIHTDERSEICEVCGKAFRLKAHLRTHLRTHTGEKLWGCEKCGVRYTDKRSYNRHIERCIIK